MYLSSYFLRFALLSYALNALSPLPLSLPSVAPDVHLHSALRCSQFPFSMPKPSFAAECSPQSPLRLVLCTARFSFALISPARLPAALLCVLRLWSALPFRVAIGVADVAVVSTAATSPSSAARRSNRKNSRTPSAPWPQPQQRVVCAVRSEVLTVVCTANVKGHTEQRSGEGQRRRKPRQCVARTDVMPTRHTK